MFIRSCFKIFPAHLTASSPMTPCWKGVTIKHKYHFPFMSIFIDFIMQWKGTSKSFGCNFIENDIYLLFEKKNSIAICSHNFVYTVINGFQISIDSKLLKILHENAFVHPNNNPYFILSPLFAFFVSFNFQERSKSCNAVVTVDMTYFCRLL